MLKTLTYFFLWTLLNIADLHAIAKSEQQFNLGVDFNHYHATLEPDFDLHSISGEVEVHFTAKTENISMLSFSVKNIKILDVTSDFELVSYHIENERLIAIFRNVLVPNRKHTLNIMYESTPKRGVKFYKDHLFTVYHTNRWLVSHWNISDKASFTLDLIHPKDFVSVGNGKLISQRILSKNRIVSRWHESIPIPIYTFGFVTGKFDKIKFQDGEFTFNYLSRSQEISGFDKKDIKNIFVDVHDINTFLEGKAGFALPNKEYSFIFVDGQIAQEASGFSLVGEQYGHSLLNDPNENWFIIHELAHEWWGSSITCASFSHFWLNEGLVQFIVATYRIQRA